MHSKEVTISMVISEVNISIHFREVNLTIHSVTKVCGKYCIRIVQHQYKYL